MLDGGHLQTMLTNAKEVSAFMLNRAKGKGYIPAIDALMAPQWDHEKTLAARGNYLNQNIEQLLRDLFKDEVRTLGKVLGVPDPIIWRHPFPGPGLAVRCLGEVKKELLDVLRDCDEILLEEIIANHLYNRTSQVFTVLLPIKSVGVMGDYRTYENVVAVRAVETQDFMTADWARIPHQVLATISNRIINEVRGVNRVVYDISSKPPATIEWE